MKVVLLLLAVAAQAAALVIPAAGRMPLAPSFAPAAAAVTMKDPVVRVEIELENGEPLEKALRRFRKATNVSGHVRLLRNKRTFESAHDMKIRKSKESLQRLARARRAQRARQ